MRMILAAYGIKVERGKSSIHLAIFLPGNPSV